jgi:3-keto-5-aminohexanoate cleavage enzyme
MDKLIVSVAVNGADLGKGDTPHVPVTPGEIAESVVAAGAAGAAIAHVHVRDGDGRPSSEVALFRQVLDRVRAQCDVVLTFSTDLRLPSGTDALELGPELGSLPAGSVNLGDEVMVASRPTVRDVAERMRVAGVRPELEIFHEGMIATARLLVEEGIVDDPVLCQFCLGFDGGAPADATALTRMVAAVPPHWTWSVAVEGGGGLPLLVLALTMGGHVRVGMEDHPYYMPGELATSNAQLVERIVRIAGALGRPVASADEARAMLGLRAAGHERVGDPS